jgi:Domain of unknown function (DUF4202)
LRGARAGGLAISELTGIFFRSLERDCQGPFTDLPCLHLAAADWDSPSFNFYDFDFRVDVLAESGLFALTLAGEPGRLPRVAAEVFTRCQRHMDRRNAASRGAQFDRVLAAHRALHDLAKPLVRADWNHSLDTWQWALRLDRDAGLAVQLAALFHDVERLITEADSRIEHRSRDYQGFKDDHARRGAELASATLAAAGVGFATIDHVARLIVGHERPPAPDDPDAADLALLNDADALSFFSLNSVGYLDYFGPEPTRRKVAWTLRRLRPAARRHLAGMRLVPEIAETLAAEMAEMAEVEERVA